MGTGAGIGWTEWRQSPGLPWRLYPPFMEELEPLIRCSLNEIMHRTAEHSAGPTVNALKKAVGQRTPHLCI